MAKRNKGMCDNYDNKIPSEEKKRLTGQLLLFQSNE